VRAPIGRVSRLEVMAGQGMRLRAGRHGVGEATCVGAAQGFPGSVAAVPCSPVLPQLWRLR
jgi:hypothetical protein